MTPRAGYPPAQRGQLARASKGVPVFSRNKYRAKPVRTEEGFFASQKEYRDWQHLKLREKAGELSHLQRQVSFPLTINNQLICTYKADAVWFEAGRRVVADSKGVKTETYRLKKKLLKALLNIDILEM